MHVSEIGRENNIRSRPLEIGLLFLMLLAPLAAVAGTIDDSIKFIKSSGDYIEITPSDGVAVDLRYATSNNFVGRNMYGAFNHAFLHRIAATKLSKAVEVLKNLKPGYRIVIFDALRPRSVQYVLWNQVKGTAQEKYVANPKGGSIHNFGLAVDLSLLDPEGRPVDMGTSYDDFTPLAEPRLEEKFLKEGKLSAQQVQNRKLLRRVMEEAGFITLPVEWWHFDALPKAEVRSKYPIVE